MKRLAVRKRPSAGFVAVCLTYLCVGAFFIFGFTTPDLDRVWTLHHLLKIGELDTLDDGDKKLLTRAMARHHGLAKNLLDGVELGLVSAHLDGWLEHHRATLIRTPDASFPGSVVLRVESPAELLPLTAVLAGPDWIVTRQVTARGVLELPLPRTAQAPEIMTLVLQGDALRSDQQVMLGVKVEAGVQR